MGILVKVEKQKTEVEEFIRSVLKCGGGYQVYYKGEDQLPPRLPNNIIGEEEPEDNKLVCVTSGASFLGLAIVNHLLRRGYLVRIAVHNQGDLEKLREMEEMFEEGNGAGVTVVTAKMTDVESLCDAFRGCRGVFHTSAFADPAGVAGYSKFMAELEERASKNVMEACSRTESVRRCVLTSSLLACVWRDHSLHDLAPVLNHYCWSDETVCRDKKLWFALGKTRAEKAAWKMAENRKVKLATICPGLLRGPEFLCNNPTASIAYMKGAEEMYMEGVLATTDISRVAEAHVCVYEAMRGNAFGRYICFDRVISNEDDVAELANQMGLPVNKISGTAPGDSLARFKLCNRKLSRLMSKQSKCY